MDEALNDIEEQHHGDDITGPLFDDYTAIAQVTLCGQHPVAGRVVGVIDDRRFLFGSLIVQDRLGAVWLCRADESRWHRDAGEK